MGEADAGELTVMEDVDGELEGVASTADADESVDAGDTGDARVARQPGREQW